MNSLNINGKEYPFRFSFIAIRKFSKLTGIALEDLGNMSSTHILEILYSGLYGGSRKAKIEWDLHIDDLELWLDDNFDKIESIMEMVSTDLSDGEEGK